MIEVVLVCGCSRGRGAPGALIRSTGRTKPARRPPLCSLPVGREYVITSELLLLLVAVQPQGSGVGPLAPVEPPSPRAHRLENILTSPPPPSVVIELV